MYYIINRETEKLELHFDKSEYQALADDQKSAIKSNFLFSKRGGCWVSRAKIPNLWRAEQVAKGLGAENQRRADVKSCAEFLYPFLSDRRNF